MDKIFITIIILYALYVGIFSLQTAASKKGRKNVIRSSSSTQEAELPKSEIVGKSKFVLKETMPISATSKPIEATSPESENGQEKPDIFVPPNEEKPSSEVPLEQLDETFSDTPPDEEDKPMDIEYPLEYETSEEEEEDEEQDESEEEEYEEIEGMAGATLASGTRFEDLGNAVRTVNHRDSATPEQRKQAGNTFLEMRKTDMFEQIVSGKQDARRIVTDLMAESLAEFHSRKERESGTAGNGRKVPEHFNIRDFV